MAKGFGRVALELLREVAYVDPEHIPKHNDVAIKEVLMQVRRSSHRGPSSPRSPVSRPGLLPPPSPLPF